MATAELPQRSGMDMGGIASLANLFLPKNASVSTTGTTQNSGGTTTSGSKTTSSNVSQDAVNALVQQILEGSQGLAATASGQKRAGLYNSSTNQMLVNDLIARASAEGAKLNKSETTSVTETQQDNRATTTSQNQVQQTKAPVSPQMAGGLVGGLQLVSSLRNTDIGKKLTSSIFGGASAKTATTSAGSSSEASGSTSQQAATDGTGSGPDSINSTPSVTATGSPATNSVGSIAGSEFGVNVGSNDASVESIINDMETVSPGFDNFDIGADFGTDVDFGSIGNIDIGSDGGFSFDDFGSIGEGGGDWGVDPGTLDFGEVEMDPSVLFDFAEGGLVTKDGNERTLRKYVNRRAEEAFDSGGDDSKPKQENTEHRGYDTPKAKPAVDKPEAKSEDKTPKQKSLNVRIMEYVKNRAPFARGGMVDLTNTGLRNQPGDTATPLDISGGTQSVGSVKTPQSSINGGGTPNGQGVRRNNDGTRATNLAGAKIVTDRQRLNTRIDTTGSGTSSGGGVAADAASPGVGAGSGIGVAGIGTAGGIIGGLTGLPGLGSVTGLASATNNNAAVASVASAIATAITANPLAGLVVNAIVSGGSQSNSDAIADNANAISAINDQDALDTLVALLDGKFNGADTPANAAIDGLSAESGGAVGDSSGNGVGAGGAGAGGTGVGGSGGDGVGVGGPNARGGHIKGPGTETSDSIDAQLSDGEYVINAAAVKHFGKDFFDQINEAVQPAPVKLQQGEKIRKMQRGW
jgi:hypothetical protein